MISSSSALFTSCPFAQVDRHLDNLFSLFWSPSRRFLIPSYRFLYSPLKPYSFCDTQCILSVSLSVIPTLWPYPCQDCSVLTVVSQEPFMLLIHSRLSTDYFWINKKPGNNDNFQAGLIIFQNVCFPGGSDSKEYACNAGKLGSTPGSGRSPGEGISYPIQCSCWESSMDIGVWWAILHGVTKSQMKLKDTCSLEVKLWQT